MYFMGIYEVRYLSDLISQRTCIEGANIYVVVHYGERLSGAGVLCVPELTSVFANFCDLEKIAKLSTRKHFYQHIGHSDTIKT